MTDTEGMNSLFPNRIPNYTWGEDRIKKELELPNEVRDKWHLERLEHEKYRIDTSAARIKKDTEAVKILDEECPTYTHVNGEKILLKRSIPLSGFGVGEPSKDLRRRELPEQTKEKKEEDFKRCFGKTEKEYFKERREEEEIKSKLIVNKEVELMFENNKKFFSIERIKKDFINYHITQKELLREHPNTTEQQQKKNDYIRNKFTTILIAEKYIKNNEYVSIMEPTKLLRNENLTEFEKYELNILEKTFKDLV